MNILFPLCIGVVQDLQMRMYMLRARNSIGRLKKYTYMCTMYMQELYPKTFIKTPVTCSTLHIDFMRTYIMLL